MVSLNQTTRKFIGSEQGNGQKPKGKFGEIGVTGFDALAGKIAEAYLSELRYPDVIPTYKKLWRADPEVCIARFIIQSMASNVDFHPQEPENATDDDKRAIDFMYEEMDNLEGGIARWKNKVISTTPFWGWAWWEIVPSMRRKDWRPPGTEDTWTSQYDDGLIGCRRLAWRDYTSFYKWDLTDAGVLLGMWQLDTMGKQLHMPLNRAVHVNFGDADNPEGTAVLEAIYRLERYMTSLELVMGIGFEHTAGHLSVTFEEDYAGSGADDSADEDKIKKAARAVMMAQEGNYAAWPPGIKGEILDSNFSAAEGILSAIKYFGLRKLQLINMQWVAMSTTTGTGSFASMQDSSTMSVVTFNSMMEGFVDQLNRQYVDWLFKVNAKSFPNLSVKPKIVATKARKDITPDDMAGFLEWYSKNFPMSEQDLLQVRTQSGILPESLPSDEDIVLPFEKEEKPETEPEPSSPDEDTTEDEAEEEIEEASLVKRILTRLGVGFAEKD